MGPIFLRDSNVSAKPVDLCPSNRTLLKQGCEGLFIESREFIQTRREADRRRLEPVLVGWFSAQIEWAHIEAIVASEYFVSHALV